MKATTTRTLNPLPFQDLEPHRFEDLVRQLVYEFRDWARLEATGRSGSDDGFDVRAIERARVPSSPAEADGEIEDEDGEARAPAEPTIEERVWAFQCKREKALGPAKMREVVEASLVSMAELPHGFVLAVASDVSKKARDVFRDEMVKRRIEEFAVWGKGELEDMLFQPKHDRLLFAYFGLSLEPRRRSLVSTLRSEIAMKKQLLKLFGDNEDFDSHRLILLRDPTDTSYPPREGAHGLWVACHAKSLKNPGLLIVLRYEHFAAITPDGRGWDAIEGHDLQASHVQERLHMEQAWGTDDPPPQSGARDFWEEYIEEDDRVYLKVYRCVSLDRILAVDPIGDGYYSMPHLFVEFDPIDGPFTPLKFRRLERAHPYRGMVELRPEAASRVRIFPDPLPGLLEVPPEQFDGTLGVATSLSEPGSVKLRSILARMSERREQAKSASDVPDTVESSGSVTEPGHAFQEWCERVARPVFSAFVARLRTAGHGARIALRSLDAFASIQLKLQLRIATPYNPDYTVKGHVMVSTSVPAAWTLTVYPPPEAPTSKRGYVAGRADAEPTLPDARAFSAAELEDLVLGVLERLER